MPALGRVLNFRSTGAHVRALALLTFMDNILRQAAMIRNGVISGTIPDDFTMPWTEMIAEVPEIIARFADGTFDAPYTGYPLSRVGEAWAHQGRTRAVVVPG